LTVVRGLYCIKKRRKKKKKIWRSVSLIFPWSINPDQFYELFRYVLRGIRRIQGNTLRRPPRNSITVSHLLSMLGFLSSSSFSAHDKAMWHSVIVTAFFGLLRVSEFTCPDNTFDASSHLSREDISFNRNNSILYIKIKASKTDPFRAGVIIRLAAIRGHKLCPVAAMRSYLLGFSIFAFWPAFYIK